VRGRASRAGKAGAVMPAAPAAQNWMKVRRFTSQPESSPGAL
jgi:hypothetical protein